MAAAALLLPLAGKTADVRSTDTPAGVDVAVTGWAGVLADATFATLVVLPVVTALHIGLIVALGVLLDVMVRTLLIPTLAVDLGPRVWWPSRPAPTACQTATEPRHGPASRTEVG